MMSSVVDIIVLRVKTVSFDPAMGSIGNYLYKGYVHVCLAETTCLTRATGHYIGDSLLIAPFEIKKKKINSNVTNYTIVGIIYIITL